MIADARVLRATVFPLDDRHIGMYVLDVSGHGVQSALLSVAITRSLLPRPDRSSLVMGLDSGAAGVAAPSDVAARLNRIYPFENNIGQFFTLVYGVLDVRTGEFRYVCAGHPGPLVAARDGRVRTLDAPAPPIGLVSGLDYRDASIRLEPGDRLYLYSDGLYEEIDARREQFGRDRLADSVAHGRRETLEQSVRSLIAAVIRWRGGGELRDDLSILAVELGAR